MPESGRQPADVFTPELRTAKRFRVLSRFAGGKGIDMWQVGFGILIGIPIAIIFAVVGLLQPLPALIGGIMTGLAISHYLERIDTQGKDLNQYVMDKIWSLGQSTLYVGCRRRRPKRQIVMKLDIVTSRKHQEPQKEVV